jgi:vacuolar iron transporter family protein
METTVNLQQLMQTVQKNEITEYYVYKRIAATVSDKGNAKIIEKIAADKLDHYQRLKNYTRQDIKPNWLRVWFYTSLCRNLALSLASN